MRGRKWKGEAKGTGAKEEERRERWWKKGRVRTVRVFP